MCSTFFYKNKTCRIIFRTTSIQLGQGVGWGARVRSKFSDVLCKLPSRKCWNHTPVHDISFSIPHPICLCMVGTGGPGKAKPKGFNTPYESFSCRQKSVGGERLLRKPCVGQHAIEHGSRAPRRSTDTRNVIMHSLENVPILILLRRVKNSLGENLS